MPKVAKNAVSPLKIETVQKPTGKKNQERLSTVIDQSFFMRRGMTRKNAEVAALDFNEKMHEWTTNQAEITRLETLVDITKSEAFELAKTAYIEFYSLHNKQPENFHVVSGDNEVQFMFQGTDAYIKISEAEAITLRKRYGNEVVTQSEEYKFDTKLFKKYLPEIKKAIEAMNIPHTDRQNLLKKEVGYAVAKGTIGNIADYTANGDVKVEDVIADVRPIFKIVGISEVSENA